MARMCARELSGDAWCWNVWERQGLAFRGQGVDTDGQARPIAAVDISQLGSGLREDRWLDQGIVTALCGVAQLLRCIEDATTSYICESLIFDSLLTAEMSNVGSMSISGILCLVGLT